MKTLRVPALLAVALLLNSARLPAQVLTALHTFSANTSSNMDGAGPNTELVISGNTLYGAAGGGANGSGSNNFGTVFSIGVDGSNFMVLHTFAGVTSSDTLPKVSVNADGFQPQGTMILSGGMLYGSAANGGTNGSGTLFAVSTDGSIFTVLHTFETNDPARVPATNSEGSFPNSLVLCGDTLYGTAKEGGVTGFGTLFSIKTNGDDFTVLHTFSAADGETPQSVLAASNGIIYGATPLGGAGAGTVYSYATNGAKFTVLHDLPAGMSTETGPFLDGLLLNGGTLFGTASVGGSNSTGSIYSLNTNGGAFTVFYNFNTNGFRVNFDGVQPLGALTLIGDTLYGTAIDGGVNGNGTIYSVNTNGSEFSTLYMFTKLRAATNFDGVHPHTGVVNSGAFLYGTAYFGAGNANGSVFSLSVNPTVTNLSLSGSNAILNGMNGLSGHAYTVLSSPDITLPLANWNPVSTNVLAGGGQFSIIATNAVNPAAAQMFYELETQ